MKDNELKQICDLLANEYGKNGHFQVIAASLQSDGWSLSVQRVEPEEEQEAADDNK